MDNFLTLRGLLSRRRSGVASTFSSRPITPTGSGLHFNGPLESTEFSERMFARRGALSLDGFGGPRADWLERFTPYIASSPM
jgi:hypothetical protein